MTTALMDLPATDSNGSNARQVALVHLAAECYGVDIADVIGVLKLRPIKRVAKFPRFIKGVINYRGCTLAVLDLKKWLRLPEVSEASIDDAKIVVVQSSELTAGLIVDRVSDVVSLLPENIKYPDLDLPDQCDGAIAGIASIPIAQNHISEVAEPTQVVRLLNVVEAISSVFDTVRQKV